MSLFSIHHEISILNFHTDPQTGNLTLIFVWSFVFRFDFWLNIQDFIFGLVISIFPIHRDISRLNFLTDFQSGKVKLNSFRFDFWLEIEDSFGACHVNFIIIVNFHTDYQSGKN
jgi:hypothetical protein